MVRAFVGLAVLGSLLAASVAAAESSALLAASDAAQIEQLTVAKVMASDSSLWLSVRWTGKGRLAVVTADSAVEAAKAADAWLRALDFNTRMRVAAPPGPLASCGANQQFEPVDTGLPEPAVIDVARVETVNSELELRRALEAAGLDVDPERIAHFTQGTAAPFRVSLYDVPGSGGDTAALRLHERGAGATAPQLELVSRDAVPISLIALATAAVLPAEGSSADPSEFPVSYRAASSSSDYRAARAQWLAEQPTRWLIEVQNSSSLFASTVFPPLEPVMTRYLRGLGADCVARVRGAYAHGSQDPSDYRCDDHDDLSLSLAQLGFAELRLSRLYGSLGPRGTAFRVLGSAVRSPLLAATDFDPSDCAPVTAATPASGSGAASPGPQTPVVVSGPGSGDGYPSDPGTPVYTDDGSCNVTIFDSGSDSCSGDSSSDSSGDSCSGDSSSDSSGDSCSGNSSSDSSGDSCSGDSGTDSTSDSCSGDSDSSSDSSGCGKNDGYDGDTCSGNSHSSAEATRTSSDELRLAGAPARRRPRAVHLSLLTLLAAALALPLRRLRPFRP